MTELQNGLNNSADADGKQQEENVRFEKVLTNITRSLEGPQGADYSPKVTVHVGKMKDLKVEAGFDVVALRGVALTELSFQEMLAQLQNLTPLSRAGSYLVCEVIQGVDCAISIERLRNEMKELGWVPVAQDGDGESRTVVVAFHRPFADSCYFVTSNPMKLLEMRHAAKHPHLHGCDFDLPELKHDSIERIAEDKARQAYAVVGRPVLCTDGGIFMDAYDGFPGPNSKQAATKLKPEGLLRLLVGVENRNGKRMNAAAFFDGKKMSTNVSVVPVRFAFESKGTYPSYPMDKILIPDTAENPNGLTYAEMPPEDRGRVTEVPALAAFAQSVFLETE